MDMLSSVANRMTRDAKRHEILAGNIANAQTPGYKSRDLSSSDFGYGMSLAVAKTSAAHLSGGASEGNLSSAIRPGQEDMAAMDGNTVDLDKERALLAQNALDLEAQMRFATHYLRKEQIVAG